MTRITLSDGRWFDNKCQSWDEDRWFNGSNQISKATGSQWNHEKLYQAKSGTYVLHTWSAWQGTAVTYEIVDDETAHRWLATNNHYDAIPADVVASLEI